MVVRTFVGSPSVTSSTRSASGATSSSMNSGLPSAVITTRSAVPRCPEHSIGIKWPASVRASSGDSGYSCIEVCDISPAPQVGRESSSSGRARAKT
jgi:hypothetical protein